MSSPGHGLLAWSADRDGHEIYAMRIRDLATGADLPDRLEGTCYGAAWSADERYLFYTRPDHAMRPYQVWRHEVGAAQDDDVLVYEEPDERYNVDLELSGAARTSSSPTRPTPRPTCSCSRPTSRWPSRCSWPSAGRTSSTGWNTGATASSSSPTSTPRTSRSSTAPCDSPAPAEWVDLVPHQAGRRITRVEPFVDHLVLHEWSDALERIRILRSDGSERTLDFEDPVHSVAIGSNPEYHTPTVRFTYESLVTPPSVYDEDVSTGDRLLLKRAPVLGGYDPADYDSARESATAPDGTNVPVDVVWKRGTPRDGTAPLSLYGYGAYEYSRPPWFSIERLSFLDRGGVWALVHRVAAASSAGPGTSTASSSTSGTPSPTSSPAPSTWSSRATARRTGSRPTAGAPAACSSGPASPCGRSSTPGSSPPSPSWTW